jgi:hypothetical protein
MTAKCCRDCINLKLDDSKSPGENVLMQCTTTEMYAGYDGPIIIVNLDTFYCAAFTRRNSAKPVGIPIEYERDVDGEIVRYKDSANKNSENTQNTQPEEEQQLPPIQRRFT